jgi:hypothetical protein
MKPVLVVCIYVLVAVFCFGQTSGVERPLALPSPSSSGPPSLDAILIEIQQATQAANTHIARLKIDRWKADSADKAQWQQMVDSLHKNITYAVPDLITEVRADHGSVSTAFRLYHNVTVVYEYVDSMTAAASTLGRKDEYEPLNSDTAALDQARQHLSAYIEQAAASLENKLRAAVVAATPPPAPQATPKKVVVDDDTSKKKKSATTRKKKASTPTPSPTPN